MLLGANAGAVGGEDAAKRPSRPSPTSTPIANEEKAIVQEFLSLVEKSQQFFSGLRDLPAYGREWQTYFTKTFEVFTKLWRFQQEKRKVLENKENYGLKRWEVGDIASKIGQLYYHYYLRTSETNYLQESFVFYNAIRSRLYFKDISKAKSVILVVKKLRYFARFIMVCLLLDKTSVVEELLSELSDSIAEYEKEFDGSDAPEWKQVVGEIRDFLKEKDPMSVDDEKLVEKWMLGKRGIPLEDKHNYLIPRPASAGDAEKEKGAGEKEKVVETQFYLSEAIVVGHRDNQLKFSEITLDMYRFMLTVEREVGGDQVAAGAPVERAQPRKHLLYKPSVSSILVGLASLVRDIGVDGVRQGAILCYLSADEADSAPSEDDPAKSKPWSSIGAVRMSKSQEPLPILYPEDLLPFTRRPFLCIVDTDNARAFARMTPVFSAPVLFLLSGRQPASDSLPSRDAKGSLLTHFLHSPIAAMCQLAGISSVGGKDMATCIERLKRLVQDIDEAVSQMDIPPAFSLFWKRDMFARLILSRFLMYCGAMQMFEGAKSESEHVKGNNRENSLKMKRFSLACPSHFLQI